MTQPQPAFVLVRPQMGENIGAAARAMWNFSLDRMRVVEPRDGWPSPKAVAMASGAGRLLDEAGLFDDVPAAIADCTHVYATTARPRDLIKPVMTPEVAMADARSRMTRGEKVAVLFGAERAGLENDDIVRAHTIISVPINPDFPSLNLAQAVLLVGYEWGRQVIEPVDVPDPEVASGIEVEKLGDRFEAELDAAGYFYPPDKVPHLRQTLRNLWTRMALTGLETQILHGILRQLTRKQD